MCDLSCSSSCGRNRDYETDLTIYPSINLHTFFFFFEAFWRHEKNPDILVRPLGFIYDFDKTDPRNSFTMRSDIQHWGKEVHVTRWTVYIGTLVIWIQQCGPSGFVLSWRRCSRVSVRNACRILKRSIKWNFSCYLVRLLSRGSKVLPFHYHCGCVWERERDSNTKEEFINVKENEKSLCRNFFRYRYVITY